MILFIILGVIVTITAIVMGVLVFMLGKEGKKEEKAVPITDLDQLKKDLSTQLFEQKLVKAADKNPEFIPVSTPAVSLPTQEVRSSLEDEKYKKRADVLEQELKAITLKADGQSNEARFMIETLTNENDSLKNQQASLAQAEQKLIELQGKASNLETENAGLQTQLESTNAKVHFLEEEMAAVKIQMGEEISRANAAVSELAREKEEKESLLAVPKPEADETLNRELESLKSEHVQLKQKYEDLEKSYQGLQYEMIKAKAQSSGLERVSFNYKNQLEDFFKKINAMQVSNDHLAQVKNRLEGLIEEVKLQNEELVQKDQLTQFELEKNRSRLVSLERECEALKAQAPKDPQV